MNLGKNAKGMVYISEEARKANLAVFGTKNTGKAYTLIPYLFEQDLKDKNTGVTIIVDTPRLAWFLYSMAKLENRKVEILKPSIKFEILNDLLFKDSWDYESIKKIFDYEDAIKNKKIVIIDMEQELYGSESVRAASMLLLQLQSDMIKKYKSEIKHSVYIDNAQDFMPYIKNLLKYGDYYNFFTTLFFKSRTELKDNALLVDNYVRNIMLLQGTTWTDAKYFGERMNLSGNAYDSALSIMDKQYGEFAYEILGNDFKRQIGIGQLLEFDKSKINAILKKQTVSEKRNKVIINEDQHLQLQSEKESLKKENVKGVIENIEEKIKPIDIPDETEIEEEIESVEFEDLEEPKTKDNREPQFNKTRKSSKYVEEKREDFSALDEIDIQSEFEFPENLEIDLDEEVEEPEKTVFDTEVEDFVINFGKKKDNLPYKKIKNKKVEKYISNFKI